jgi:hypothetical protein
MQSPGPARAATPVASPLPADARSSPSPSVQSDASDSGAGAGALVRVARTAGKIAELLRDLERELEAVEDTASVETRGTLQVVLKTPGENITTIALDDVSHTARVSFCVTGPGFATKKEATTVDRAGADPSNAIPIEADEADEAGATTASLHKRTRRHSDAGLEKDLVSRKRQRLDSGDQRRNVAHMQQDVADDDDIMPLITKEDLESIVAKLRGDIQEDTSECVNHVQRLLRRFKEEWHEKSTWDSAQPSQGQNGRASRRSLGGDGAMPAAAFPGADQDDHDEDITVPDLIRQESKLISSQIKWVEECRRLAAVAHDKREENWRTSSANFHDNGRQEREGFQGRILHQQGMQSQTLNQILNEVKSFGLYVQSMKWETPLSMGPAYHQGPPYQPGPPAFPAQPPPAPSRGRGRPRGSGRGRGV